MSRARQADRALEYGSLDVSSSQSVPERRGSTKQSLLTIGGRGGKELRDALRRARRAGWTVVRTGGDHIKWTDPSGHVVITASTPNRIGLQDALIRLRKAGLV